MPHVHMTYAQRMLRIPLTLAVMAAVFVPLASSAQVSSAIQGGLSGTANAAGYGSTAPDLASVVGKLIGQLLGLVGVILMAYVLYGGFMWMTAAGEPKKVSTAKDVIRDAMIGLVIIVTAYALTNFVLVNVIGSAFSGVTGK